MKCLSFLVGIGRLAASSHLLDLHKASGPYDIVISEELYIVMIG